MTTVIVPSQDPTARRRWASVHPPLASLRTLSLPRTLSSPLPTPGFRVHTALEGTRAEAPGTALRPAESARPQRKRGLVWMSQGRRGPCCSCADLFPQHCRLLSPSSSSLTLHRSPPHSTGRPIPFSASSLAKHPSTSNMLTTVLIWSGSLPLPERELRKSRSFSSFLFTDVLGPHAPLSFVHIH